MGQRTSVGRPVVNVKSLGMRGLRWAGIVLAAVVALSVVGSLSIVLAQSAQVWLANALHLDGDAHDASNDRFISIAGLDDGNAKLQGVHVDANGDL